MEDLKQSNNGLPQALKKESYSWEEYLQDKYHLSYVANSISFITRGSRPKLGRFKHDIKSTVQAVKGIFQR